MKTYQLSEGRSRIGISGIIYPAIMAIMLMGCLPAWPATYYVTKFGNDTAGDGSAASPWLTVSNAVWHSGDDDTIVVSNGVYDLETQLVVTNGITLRSYDNDRSTVVINGNNYDGKPVANRCLFVNHSNAFISGLTFSNGVVDAASVLGGGAILIMTNGTVSNCVITKSKAIAASRTGGGVYMNNGGLLLNSLISYNTVSNSSGGEGGGISINTAGTVRDCIIWTNQSYVSRSAGRAAGIYLLTGGLVDRCDVVSNQCYGEAIQLSSCSGTIRDTTVRQNYVSEGAIKVVGSATPVPVITNCIIVSNTFNYFGGIYLSGAARVERCDIMKNQSISADSLTIAPMAAMYVIASANAAYIRNCRIMDNSAASATANGMAVFIVSNTVVENCLISGNDKGGLRIGTNANRVFLSSCTIAQNANYGIHMNSYAVFTNAVTNCVIYGNGAADITNRVDSSTNLFWYCCASNSLPASQGNITGDPHFEGSSTNNYRLADGSPCVNRGINMQWMTNSVDLDGRRRIMMRNADMGAYESWPPRGAIFFSY